MVEDKRGMNAATVIACGGLLVSIFGNYLQYRKNADDAHNAERQIAQSQAQLTLSQEQWKTAKDELDRLKGNCEQKRQERDGALQAVHTHDQYIAKWEIDLAFQEQRLAEAKLNHNSVQIAEYTNLSEQEERNIKSATDDRDKAAERVREIEQLCHF